MNINWLNIILPVVCGLTAANIYYIQPLIPDVVQVTGVGFSIVSMIYTIALVGNAVALIFITPLGDFFNRKKIISSLYLMLFLVLLLFYSIGNIYILIAISFFMGLGACIIPIIIAYLGTNKTSGIASIGKIIAGVMFGILLSRFVSSFFASTWGWKSVYLFGAVCMLIALILVSYFLPRDDAKRQKNIGYFKIVMSSFSLLISNGSVRLYSASGFLVMAVFAVFWNNVPIYLTYQFDFHQFSIGIFSLVGVFGALVAIFSNKILKLFKVGNVILFLGLLITFLLMAFCSSYLAILILLTLALDGFVQLIHINNQVNMYRTCSGNESRAASCYVTSFVLGGAIGTKLSTYFYLGYGWVGISMFCVCLCIFGSILNIKKNTTVRI